MEFDQDFVFITVAAQADPDVTPVVDDVGTRVARAGLGGPGAAFPRGGY